MATRTAKLRIELDGEKEYKKAIADMNASNRVLASEMKIVQERYKGVEDSSDALRARAKVLTEQFELQSEKVVTLREAVRRAAEQYGEADRRTKAWQTQLNNAEAAEYKLERQLRETNEKIEGQGVAVEEAGGKMQGLGDQIDSLADRLGVKLPKEATEALNSMEGFSAGTVVALGAAAAAAGLLIQAVKWLHENAVEQAAWADDLLTQSLRTNLSTDLLQELEYASRFVDVSVDTLSSSLGKLTSQIGKAMDGNEELAAAFDALGVSLTDADGNLRGTYDVFLDVIDALGQISNETEADIAANQLFGRSFQDLKPLIAAGSDELQRLQQEAHGAGVVLGEENVRQLGQLDDAVQRNKAQWDALKRELAVEFAPASQEAMQLFADAARLGADGLERSGLISTSAELLANIASLADKGGALFEYEVPAWMSSLLGVLDPLHQFLSALEGVNNVLGWINSGIDWLTGHTGGYGGTTISGGYGGSHYGSAAASGGGGAISLPGDGILSVIDFGKTFARNAAGTDSWRGGLTWVGESGPELVRLPRGSAIYSNQDSRSLAAGGNTYYINVTGIRQLEEIVSWYESKQVRERMA